MSNKRLRLAHKQVCENLKNLENDFENNWKTHCQFRFNPNYTGNAATNIKEIDSVETLLTIDSYIRVKAEQYDKSAANFGIKNYPVFKWQDCTYEDWKHDLYKQYRILSNHDAKEKMIALKAELEKVFDVEDRREMLLDSMCDYGLDIKALGCGEDDFELD